MKSSPWPILLLAAALLGSAHGAPEPEDAPEREQDPPLRHELPWQVRLELPELDITVFYWNEDPDKRFVKINGERYVENEQAAPEVRLQEIRPDSLVFEFRGQRFQIRPY